MPPKASVNVYWLHCPSHQIHMHGSDMTALHDLLDPQQLPADLGGSEPPTDPSSLLELFQEDLLD